MNLKVLASSSRGNCYLLETDKDKLMLECGITFKNIKKGLNFDLTGVCGCLVTHEHKDHCKAINDVLNAGIDVYTSKGTAEALNINHHRLNVAEPKVQFEIGNLIILPFDTEHDATEPLGFLIQNKATGEKILFATDTYYVKYRFTGLNYIMVECNYCQDILAENIEKEIIPKRLKDRILESHFSLDNVKDFLKANDLAEVRKIILLHLSGDNSDSRRMQKEIKELTGIETVIAKSNIEVELKMFPF